MISLRKKIYRWIKRIIIGIGILFLLAFLLLLADTDYKKHPLDRTQLQKGQLTLLPLKDSSVYSKLLITFGKNKKLPSGFELQALIALSYYPQLKEIPIHFLIQESIIPLSSRPNPYSLFTPWKKKEYLVVISSKSYDFLEPILFKNLPFDEQIGVLGHELAHTVYYLDKSALQLAGMGVNYLFFRFRKNFERETDKRAISYGLGYQLHSYATYVRKVLNRKDLPQNLDSVEESYLIPAEIKEEMKKYPQLYPHLPD